MAMGAGWTRAEGVPINYAVRHFLMSGGFLSSLIREQRNTVSCLVSELVRGRQKTVTWIQVLQRVSLFSEQEFM